MKGLIEDALAKGTDQLTDGESTRNVLMPARVIDGMTPDMRLFRDESFRPFRQPGVSA